MLYILAGCLIIACLPPLFNKKGGIFVKKYVSPWLEEVKFEEEDIVTASIDNETEDEENPFLI